MPKVDKIEVKIKGERKTFEIWFNTKEHFHMKNFPGDIPRVTNININNQSSLGELKDAVEKALRKYHEITAEQRKIIVYRLSLSSDFHMNKIDEHGGTSYMGSQKWVPNGSERKIGGFGFDSPHHAIGLSYQIYMETQLGEKKYFRVNNDGTLGHECDEAKFRDGILSIGRRKEKMV